MESLTLALLFLSPLIVEQSLAQVPAAEAIRNANRAIQGRTLEGDGAALRRLLDRRADALEALIHKEPERARDLLLSPEDAQRMQERIPAAAASIEKDSEWEGELQIVVGDDFEHQRSRTQWHVLTPDGIYEMFFGKREGFSSKVTGGMRVRVSGIGIRKSIAVRQVSVQTAAATPTGCSTTGPQNIAYLMATMPGGPAFPAAWTPAAVQQAAFGNSAVSLNTFWKEASYGLTSATGQVFGPFALTQNFACDQLDPLQSAVLQAAAGTVDFTQFTRYAIVFPTSSCPFGGWGTIGCQTLTNSKTGSFAWFPVFPYQSSVSLPLAHEHGHNLGLDHANSVDYGNAPLGALDNDGVEVEYGDPFSIMGTQGGQYSGQHKGQILGWLQAGTGYREITTSGTYTVLPFESAGGVRALRILRDAATSSWLWLEFRQPIGAVDSTFSSRSPPTTVFNGASLRYENPNLKSNATYLLDFTPVSVPNDFNSAILQSGQTWSDPVTPLRLTVMNTSANGLTVAVNYDPQCASVITPPAAASAAAVSGAVTVTAPAGCAWTAIASAPWITFTGAASGVGSGSVSFVIAANPGSTQRKGYIQVQRQSTPVLQFGTGGTVVSASPNSGSGTSATVTVTFNDSKPAGFSDISSTLISFLGTGGCEIFVQPSSQYLYLLNDARTQYVSLPLAGGSQTISNSQCTVLASGSSIAGSGNQLTVTVHVSFASTFTGGHTIMASVTDVATTTYGPFPVGSWTVPAVLGPQNVGFFQPNGGPRWVLDSNGSGQYESSDQSFVFAGQPGVTAVTGDWNGDGRTKVGYYTNGFWVLDYNGNGIYDGTGPGGDKFYAYGGSGPGFIPVVGDWNGDGRTKIGFYQNGFWVLDVNGDGTYNTGDSFIAFGGNGAGETPVLGDWNGDKRTKVGYFYKGKWVLDYDGNGSFGAADKYYPTFPYNAGDVPVVGDWTGDGKTKIGVFRGGFWILDYNNNGTYDGIGAGGDKVFGFGGNPGEVPIVADWNGSGTSKIGVYINGFWVLDYNGNGTYDGTGPGGDRFIAFGGTAGNQPIIGRW